jgi:tetratricopeptide (TPR) repeat protein
MINRGFLRLSIFIFLFLCFKGRGLSQPSQESEYQKVIKEAIVEYEAGRFDEAGRLFEEAHAIRPSARTLRGIGMVAFGARDYARAVEALEKSLVDKRRPLSAQMHEHVAILLQKAKLFVSRFTLRIDPPREDVVLTIDGNSAKLSQSRELLINPGDHQLVITTNGYKTEIRNIVAVSGKKNELTVQLVPLGKLEDDDRGQTFKVAVDRKRAGENASVNDNKTATDSTFNTIAWISVTASALSLGGGIAALVLRNAKASEYNKCSDDAPSCLNAAADAIRDAEILVGIGFACTGVFAGSAITFFILILELLDASVDILRNISTCYWRTLRTHRSH